MLALRRTQALNKLLPPPYMTLFTYRATNDDNKEVRGSIESPDEINARTALENLNLEVIEISEASRNKAPTTPSLESEQKMPVFAFEGKDSTGTVRRGTMQAQGKYEAFKRLRDDQKLFLTMLSPVGILPQYKDAELDQWQRGVKQAPTSPSAPPAQAKQASPRPTIGFTNIAEPTPAKVVTPVSAPENKVYHPLTATLRLYAGWLLAWYGLFVAVGYYSVQRTLPWDIPFVQAFYLSPLIFSFIAAIFIFLLMSALHKTTKGGFFAAIVYAVLGTALFAVVKPLA